MRNIEILSPAGDMEKLRYAIAYGAHAVYLSGSAFGMRDSCGNFPDSTLQEAIAYAHKRGVAVYVTVNTMPREYELGALAPHLEHLAQWGADALIIADLGVMQMAQRYAPQVPIHISTQAGIVNSECVSMYAQLGAKRVVLARELSLEEIAAIRDHVPPEMELEGFVHGSMCVSWSGRCLLSQYMTGRDANRGQCAQPCRWKYVLEEETRPGQYFPIEEDRGGTYIFNSKDMCTIEHLPRLIDAGLSSLKIEGRAKTFYYTAVITAAYRAALDSYLQQPVDWRCPQALLDEVEKVSHREYFPGFYFGMDTPSQHYPDSRYIREWNVAAIVEQCTPQGRATVIQKNKFVRGQELELLAPDGTVCRFPVEDIWDEDGAALESAPHPQMRVELQLPRFAPEFSILRYQTAP